jgi:hypothetical protein
MQKLIIGNLSEDASVVELASGMNVMNFNVAVNES